MDDYATPKRGNRLPPLLPIAVAATTFGAVGGTAIDAVVPMAAVALLWSALVIAIAPSVARAGARSRALANAPVLTACPLALIVLGGAILGQVLSATPQFSLVLFQQPAYGMFYLAIHAAFEWLLLPAALMLNWHHRARRTVLFTVAAVFYLGRISSALYFAPNAMAWGQLPPGSPVSTDVLGDVQLWVNVNWIRIALQDALVAVLLLITAVRHSGNRVVSTAGGSGAGGVLTRGLRHPA